MGKKFHDYGLAPSLNFDEEEKNRMETNIIEHEPITRQTLIEALRRAKSYDPYSDQLPPGKLVAVPDAHGKYVFKFLGNGTHSKTDIILGKSGQVKLNELTFKEQVKCRSLYNEINENGNLDAILEDSNKPSTGSNGDGEHTSSIDIRPGVWNGYKGTQNLLKYKDGDYDYDDLQDTPKE